MAGSAAAVDENAALIWLLELIGWQVTQRPASASDML